MSRPAGKAHSINKALTDAQVKTLLTIVGAGKKADQKLAFFWVMLSGCRIAEALSIRLSDVIGADGKVLDTFVLNHLNTKSSKTREVFLGNKARKSLQNYISSLSADTCADARLFAWNASYACTMVKEAMKASGLDYRYSSHSLRKTWAHKAQEQNISITYISNALGHSTIGVTAHYLRTGSEDTMKAVSNVW